MSLTFNGYVTDFTVKCQWHNCSKVDSFSLFLVRHSLFSPVKPPFRVLFCEFPLSRPFTFCKEYSLSVEGCCLVDVDEMHRLLSASWGCPHWRTTFCAQRAIASISRDKSWKAVAKKHKSWKSLQEYSCFSFATFAAWREKISRDCCSSLAKLYGFFSQSRRVYWAAEMIRVRGWDRWEAFGLERRERGSCVGGGSLEEAEFFITPV